MSSSPVFLAGVDRSGIGFLGEILEAHPSVAISRRTNFWRFYYRRFGDLALPGNLERCIDEMLRYTRIRALVVNLDELLEDVRGGEPTYGRLFEALQQQNLRRLRKRRWGDKSLDAEGYADDIFREFPDARMIHVLRDPRDRYASQSRHRRASRGKVGAGADLWLWSVQRARRNSVVHRGRYMVVRYEDLVAHAQEVIEDVCAFIEEDPATEMMPLPSDSPSPARSQTWPRAISTASVGRYRRDLTRREVAFIELVSARRMTSLGYPLDEGSMAPRDRLGLASTVPLHFTLMGAARLQRVLGARVRARPSHRRLASGSPPRSRCQVKNV
jgi:hypothetical protein